MSRRQCGRSIGAPRLGRPLKLSGAPPFSQQRPWCVPFRRSHCDRPHGLRHAAALRTGALAVAPCRTPYTMAITAMAPGADAAMPASAAPAEPNLRSRSHSPCVGADPLRGDDAPPTVDAAISASADQVPAAATLALQRSPTASRRRSTRRWKRCSRPRWSTLAQFKKSTGASDMPGPISRPGCHKYCGRCASETPTQWLRYSRPFSTMTPGGPTRRGSSPRSDTSRRTRGRARTRICTPPQGRRTRPAWQRRGHAEALEDAVGHPEPAQLGRRRGGPTPAYSPDREGRGHATIARGGPGL